MAGPVHDKMLLRSCCLLPDPIQDHATVKDLLPCAVPCLKNAAPNLLPQDVVRVALTIHLTQSQDAQDGPDRLQSAAQQLIQLPSIPLRELILKPLPSAHVSAIQPSTSRHKYQQRLPIHAVMVLEGIIRGGARISFGRK
jgi:hypothetical protein